MLSPEWTIEQEEAEAADYRAQLKKKTLAAEAQNILKQQKLSPAEELKELEKLGDDSHDSDPEKSSLESSSTKRPETGHLTARTQYSETAKHAFDSAGAKAQPFTIQPFRDEMSRIITIYIAEGAPRQLNLSSRERTAVLRALAVTTHPSAFRNVLKTVEWSLRRQAHPNFIRWSICNGNRPRVIFARVSVSLASLAASSLA